MQKCTKGVRYQALTSRAIYENISKATLRTPVAG